MMSPANRETGALSRVGPDEVRVLAPAKVNLFFELISKRSDGYHNISTVMHTIDLFDSITLRRAKSGVELRTSGMDVPQGRENVVHRAAELILADCGLGAGVEIVLEKNIPPGSGLGGGSSDAAATLTGLDELFGLCLPRRKLEALAARLGSDVPFFVQGGTALCEGRGELLTPITTALSLDFVLICPPFPVSTAEAYAHSKMALTTPRRRANIVVCALEKGDIAAIPGGVFNRLEEIAMSLHPSLFEVKKAILALGLMAAGMSGSGSAFFGICRSRKEVEGAIAELRGKGLGKVFAARSWLGSAGST